MQAPYSVFLYCATEVKGYNTIGQEQKWLLIVKYTFHTLC